MAFGSNNENNYTEKSMNTKSFNFYNRDPKVGSMLGLGFWNSCMSMRISPMLPEAKRGDKKLYNHEVFVNTALPPEKAMTLLRKIKKHIEPKILEGNYDFEDIGVPVGAGYVEISNGEKFNRSGDSVCLTIYTKVDEAGKTEEYLTYEFNKASCYKNYNNVTGSIAKDLDEVEFALFTVYLEQGIEAMTNAIAHSIRNTNKFQFEKETENMKSIMKKLGIDTGFSGGSNKPNGFFSAGSGRMQSNDGEGLGEDEISYESIAGDRLVL